MKKIINIFAYNLVKLIQIALMAIMVILQKLTHKSAGVNHHLYYRKVQYNSKYFIDSNVLSVKIILILLFVFVLIFLFRNIKKIRKLQKVELVLILLWLILIIATLSLNYFNKLLVYPYLIFAEFISLSLETIIYFGIVNSVKR